MTFSGPGFATPLAKNGTVTNGQCYVDPVAEEPGEHQVTTTVPGENGTLTTRATTFDVVPNTISICPQPFRDYSRDAARGNGEPYIAGLNVNLVDNDTGSVVETLTTAATGSNCFTEVPVPPEADYQVVLTSTPNGGVETTSTGLSVRLRPSPGQNETVRFGFKGSLRVCAEPVFMDNNADTVRGANEPFLANYPLTLRDEYDNIVGTTTTDSLGVGCVGELLETTYSLSLAPPVSEVQITQPAGAVRQIVATVGGGNGATSNDYTEAFGYEHRGEICPNPTFFDQNANRTRDAAEELLPDLQTRLYLGTDATGTLLQSITAGTECFDPVPARDTAGAITYYLSQDPVAGGTLTTTDEAYIFTQSFGTDTNKKFGYRGQERLCPYPTFQDNNGNGLYEPSGTPAEVTIDGVVTELRTLSGGVLATLATDHGANLCFENLLARQYRLVQTPPANTVATPEVGNESRLVTVASGIPNNVSFGYDGDPIVCPQVFRDDNGNGVRDNGENRLPGVTVELQNNGGGVIQSLTSGPTEQCFEAVQIGDYVVESLPVANYSNTNSQPAAQNPNPTFTTSIGFAEVYRPSFGYNGDGTVCADKVFEDFNANGVYDAGVDTLLPDNTTVTLQTLQGQANYPAQSTTGGVACFANISPGQYRLDVAAESRPAGSLSTTGGAQLIVLGAGQSQTISFGYTGDATLCASPAYRDANFNATYEPASETQLSGLTVNVYRGADTTTPYKSLLLSGSGSDCFTGLFAGDYRLEIQDVDTVFDGNYYVTTDQIPSETDGNDFYADLTLASEDYVLESFGFTENPDFLLGAIFGFFYIDRDSNGAYDVAGADNFELTVFDNDVPVVEQVVKLYRFQSGTSQWQEVESTVTDSAGNYAFRRLPEGQYEVRVESLVGIKSINPNPSVRTVTLATQPNSLVEKVYDRDMSFEYTARICPFFYLDFNEDGNYDEGVDYNILDNEGGRYQLAYESFNGTQLASIGGSTTFSISTSNPCLEELPPRAYTLTMPNPAATAANGSFGGQYPLSFFDQADGTSFSETIYLGTRLTDDNNAELGNQVTDLETRLYTNFVVDRASSVIQGKIWHNRPVYGSGSPYSGNLDLDGGDNLTEALNDPDNDSGYDYDWDNDYPYVGETLELIKCADGYQDPVPTSVWNVNPPTTTTDENGDYVFDETNVSFAGGDGGQWHLVPGMYAVVRRGSVPNEETLAGARAKGCQYRGGSYFENTILFDNFPSGDVNKPKASVVKVPGSTHTQDEQLHVRGVVANQPYIDQNLSQTKNNGETSCFLQSGCSTPNPGAHVYGDFELRDRVTGDILVRIPYGLRSFSNPSIAYGGTGYGGIPGVALGEYEVEMVNLRPRDENDAPYYDPISPTELIKDHTQLTGDVDGSYTYGFDPLYGDEIAGRVYISRGGGYDADGPDDTLATDFDNSEPLGGYTVKIFQQGVEQAEVVTDAEGLFSWRPNGGGNIAEGSYTLQVIDAPPSGTECQACSASTFIGVLNNTPSDLDIDLTYRYIGSVGVDSFADVNDNGLLEKQNDTLEGREIVVSNGATFDFDLRLTYEQGTSREYIVRDFGEISTPVCGIPAISSCIADITNVGGPTYSAATNLKPGTYTLDLRINDPDLALGTKSPGQLQTTLVLGPKEHLWTRYAFAPFETNIVTGQAFVDRAGQNRAFDENGEDGEAGRDNNAATFDNEIPLVGAEVSVKGPNGAIYVADALTDDAGRYAISNLPTGQYKTFVRDLDNPSNWVPYLFSTDSLLNTVEDDCQSTFGCKSDTNSQLYTALSRGAVLYDNGTLTNNFTYLFTNSLTSYYVADLNGDGKISTYSNGTKDEILPGSRFELVNENTGAVLPCSGVNYAPLTQNGEAVCTWTALPAEIEGSPARYTLAKLENAPGLQPVTLRRNTAPHALGKDGLNLGNLSTVSYTFNQFAANQTQYFGFYQTSKVITNNASITGFAFLDLNQDGAYQPSGPDGDLATTLDNELPLVDVTYLLSGLATRSATPGELGQYQFTDLAAGAYNIASDLDAGTASYTARLTSILEVPDTTNGNFYRVNFTTQGFAPSGEGRYVRFYWDTETGTTLGQEHYSPDRYEVPVSTKPPEATQLCLVVVEQSNAIIPHSGDCLPLP